MAIFYTDSGSFRNVVVSGSAIISGSLNVSQGITGSLFGTSSWAISSSQAVTSSYAITASYALNGGGGGSTNTGSLLLTASANLNTITFTKGDGSTFPVVVNTGSAITDYVSTSSFNNFTSSVVTTSSFNSWTGSTTSQFAGTASFATTASYVQNAQTASFVATASWAINAVTSSYPITLNGSTLRSVPGAAGVGGSSVNSIFFGSVAGYNATFASNATFLGISAGQLATYAANSNFLGASAGYLATNAAQSNFLGLNAGQSATNAANSNFLGNNAGNNATSASYSTLIGYQAGYNVAGGALGVKSNNIIIGTNITLPNGTQDSINLGGIIFATGSYSNTSGNPYSGSQYGIGRVGINTRTPIYDLHVSGSGNYTNGLTITGSTISTLGFTGSLQGTASFASTASYVQNAQTASYVTSSNVVGTVLSASYATTASYALNAGSTVSTASLLTTASVSSNTITFTKGDGSTFPITVATGSGGGGGGAAFPYTGSAGISGSLLVDGYVGINTTTPTAKLDVIGSTRLISDDVVAIGASYKGGIVAYILTASDAGYDPNYTRGLIAAPTDLSPSIQWYNGSYISVYPSSPDIGQGSSNTDGIVNYQGPTYADYAAGLAYDDATAGYTDWYLPSKDELNTLYINKTLIGGFSSSLYWSSTQADSPNDGTNAWSQDFGTGAQSEQDKASTYSVRAVRSFSVVKSRINVTGSSIGMYSGIGIGIGTDNPQAPLDIAGDAGATGGAGGPRFLLYGTNGTPQYLSGLGVDLGQAGSSFGFFAGNQAAFTVEQATVFENFPYPSGYTTRFAIIPGGNIGIGTVSPSAKLHVYNTSDSLVANFQAQTGDPLQILCANTLMSVGYPATQGSIGNGAGILSVKTGSADTDWAPIVYERGPMPEKTFPGRDLSGARYYITSPGIYEVTTAASNPLFFPDPTTLDGQRITIVNTDLSNDITLDNPYAPFARGDNSQMFTIPAGQMWQFLSIGGVWRGMRG